MDFPVFRQLVDWHFGNSIGCPVFPFLIYVVESQRGHRPGSGSVQQVTNCVAVCDCWTDPGLDMVEQPVKEVTYKRNFKLPSWEFNTFFWGCPTVPYGSLPVCECWTDPGLSQMEGVTWLLIQSLPYMLYWGNSKFPWDSHTFPTEVQEHILFQGTSYFSELERNWIIEQRKTNARHLCIQPSGTKDLRTLEPKL